MNYDEAIERLEGRYMTRSMCFGSECQKENEAIDLALSALREAKERENPKPLTLEELRERDGKPVYAQFGDGAEGYAVVEWEDDALFLYGVVADDHGEPDTDFINMEYDDPAGHFGLHLLGWRAYDHEPKEAQG